MSSPTSIQTLMIGSHLLHLWIMPDQSPSVEWEGQFFNHIWLLNQQVPNLSNSLYLKEFAIVSNFLWKGLKFQFIDQIKHYQHFYYEQIELEKKHPLDIFPYRLTDYKIFDVSVMHDPHLENEHLIYFVYDTTTGIPYRVICPFPYTSHSTIVHYQILPLKIESSYP